MGFLIGIVVWILLCILVGKFWESRNNEFALGLILSLFLSPLIGFLIGVITSPTTQKKCPECGEFVKREATKCRYCGHIFKKIEPQKKISKKQKIKHPKEVFFCVKCGSIVSGNDSYCPKCGEKLLSYNKLTKEVYEGISPYIMDKTTTSVNEKVKNLLVNILHWWEKKGNVSVSNENEIKLKKGNFLWGRVEIYNDYLLLWLLHPKREEIKIKTKEKLKEVKKRFNKYLEDLQQCPRCESIIPKNIKFCPECGLKLSSTFSVKLNRLKIPQDESIGFSKNESVKLLRNLGIKKSEALRIVNSIPVTPIDNIDINKAKEMKNKLKERFEVEIVSEDD